MATCKVSGYIKDGSETPIEGALIYAVPAIVPQIIEGTEDAIYPKPIESITTSSGYFELNLIRNADFVVIIRCIGFRDKVHVPDQTSTGLFSLAAIQQQADPTPSDTGEGGWT